MYCTRSGSHIQPYELRMRSSGRLDTSIAGLFSYNRYKPAQYISYNRYNTYILYIQYVLSLISMVVQAR